MSEPKVIELKEGERVIAVVPHRAQGPGWSNAPTWVWIQHAGTGFVRQECIQPEERTEDMDALYDIGDSVHCALIRAIPFKRIKEGK